MKDYAKRRRSQYAAKHRAKQAQLKYKTNLDFRLNWLWLSASLVIGSLLALMFYYQSHRQIRSQAFINPPPKINTTDESARFDFYTLLPNMSIEVSNEPTVAPSQTTSVAPKIVEKERYAIQVGSFQSYAQAEELKAQLAFLGFTTTIKTIKTSNKKIWYRVMLGPFDNQTIAQQAQQKLEQNNRFHSVIVKMSV